MSAQDYINLLNSFSQSKVSFVKEILRKDFEKTYPYDYQKYATPECPDPNICINVMVTCATEEDGSNFIFSSEDFNTLINGALNGDSEVDSSKVVRSFNMKTGITAQGRD